MWPMWVNLFNPARRHSSACVGELPNPMKLKLSDIGISAWKRQGSSVSVDVSFQYTCTLRLRSPFLAIIRDSFVGSGVGWEATLCI